MAINIIIINTMNNNMNLDLTTTTNNLKKPLGIFLVLHFPAEELGSSTKKVSAGAVSETPSYNLNVLNFLRRVFLAV